MCVESIAALCTVHRKLLIVKLSYNRSFTIDRGDRRSGTVSVCKRNGCGFDSVNNYFTFPCSCNRTKRGVELRNPNRNV